MKTKLFVRCKKCLTTSTRPRIEFFNGVCSACINFQERKKINWKLREKQLWKICNKFRKGNGEYDVVVPAGGGKDSSYVAWMLKNKFKMNPLCVCCEPPLITKLGLENLNKFKSSGFDLIYLSESKHDKKMNKIAFIKSGLPQHNWLASIQIAPLKIAYKFEIKFVMWGEEGESMYGGKNTYKNKFNVDTSLFNLKLNNNPINKFIKDSSIKKNYYWSILNKKEKKQYANIFKCYWSYFEKWDESKHLKFAKKYCGLKFDKIKQSNAINNHSHTDQKMFALHMYLAYLKFGFGRATTDTSIDIRHKKLTRKQAIKIVKKYDRIFPKNYLSDYCKYFNMTQKNFIKILHKFINKDIFEIKNKKIILLDTI